MVPLQGKGKENPPERVGNAPFRGIDLTTVEMFGPLQGAIRWSNWMFCDLDYGKTTLPDNNTLRICGSACNALHVFHGKASGLPPLTGNYTHIMRVLTQVDNVPEPARELSECIFFSAF